MVRGSSQKHEAVEAQHSEGVSSPDRTQALLEVRQLEKTFHQAGEALTVLKNLDLTIESGEMVALVGPSGSGKSTLLQLIGLLDTPTAGTINMGGRAAEKLSDAERTKLRREFIGFVYQFHYLQPEFSALENVMMPQMIAGRSKQAARNHAAKLLEALKLDHRLDHRPARLSGGEQQRVAIARALANGPRLLLADEPTGNLDPETSEDVFSILIDLVRDAGIGALIATHNLDLADRMDRALEIKAGRVLPY